MRECYPLLVKPQLKRLLKTSPLQIYLNVNCSKLTYSTPPSAPMLSAAEKTRAELAGLMAASPVNTTDQPFDRYGRCLRRTLHLY